MLLSYISRLESLSKLPPGKEKMGFVLRLGGAMPSGFSHKQLMLAERLSLSASTAFVITTAHGLLLCLSLLASIGLVMTNPCARVSTTLSKHCFWTPILQLARVCDF